MNHWQTRLLTLALAIAVTCTSPTHAFVSLGEALRSHSSSSLLRYRASDDESVGSSSYTDSLWQAALHHAHRPTHFSSPSFSEVAMDHHSEYSTSNVLPLELRPLTLDSYTAIDGKRHTTSLSTPDDGFIETAKAFVPVAIEFGVVAAVAGNAPYLFNGWQ